MQGEFNLEILIDQIAKERGFDREVLIDTLESALLIAARKVLDSERRLEARFNPDTGSIDLFQYMTVVREVKNPSVEIDIEELKKYNLEAKEGDELGFQIFYREQDLDKAIAQEKQFGAILNFKKFYQNFGRIAAQTARQVITQRMRDVERELTYNKYKNRKGELITGTVRRYERGNNIIIDLGNVEAILPANQQVERESYRPGDRILAYVLDVNKEAKGPMIILSRTHPNLLIKLFEMEIPEIREGIVRVINAVREPGIRAKIAVASREADVDPVGACVGMRGTRVQNIVQELRGEKIDIVPWQPDPIQFVYNAIQPAEVVRVIVNEEERSMELIVQDEKLSIAIGKRGQNVRLASQLTGWELDILSESQLKEIEKKAIDVLTSIEQIDQSLAATMYKLGFRSIEELVEVDLQELATIPNLGGLEVAQAIKKNAEKLLRKLKQEQIAKALAKEEPLPEQVRFMMVREMGERTFNILQEKGYSKLEEIDKEDIDRLALRTGLGLKKSRQIKKYVKEYLELEREVISKRQEEKFTDEKTTQNKSEEPK
jgi:N utilization substance protein A